MGWWGKRIKGLRLNSIRGRQERKNKWLTPHIHEGVEFIREDFMGWWGKRIKGLRLNSIRGRQERKNKWLTPHIHEGVEFISKDFMGRGEKE
jgi:hypothetical protein